MPFCIDLVSQDDSAGQTSSFSTTQNLPESWNDDRPRCREAGISDDMLYRPKWKIALGIYDRSDAEGLTFKWITADEGYGSKPGFLEGLFIQMS